MPGPGVTESRCAPCTMTRSGSPPRRLGDHVRRLPDLGSVVVSTRTVTGPAPVARAAPAPIATTSRSPGCGSRARRACRRARPVRPGWPSLKMITPVAPAVCALSALSWNVHVPRWISATLPGVKPAKSAASQPAFDELGVGRRRELVVVHLLELGGDVAAAGIGHRRELVGRGERRGLGESAWNAAGAAPRRTGSRTSAPSGGSPPRRAGRRRTRPSERSRAFRTRVSRRSRSRCSGTPARAFASPGR